MKAKRFLVTGGAGFIGSELVRQLAASGSQVIVVDNLVNGKRENLEGLEVGQVKLVVADIRDSERMADFISGVDVVFHLACLGVRHSIHSPLENHEVNATATLNLLSIAKAADVKRFVYVSSSEVYGTALWVPMTEEHPTLPMTVYGASKLAGECYARAFHRTYDYPAVVIRPFNNYGPRCHHEGDSGEVIPKFLLRTMAAEPMIIFGDGTQTRDFTYVGDCARGMIMVGLADEAIGQTVNLGYGEEVTINDLAREVASVAGKSEAKVIHEGSRPGDVLRLFADSTKARELAGFEPKIKLKEGISLLMDWYIQQEVPVEELLKQEVVKNWETKGDSSDDG